VGPTCQSVVAARPRASSAAVPGLLLVTHARHSHMSVICRPSQAHLSAASFLCPTPHSLELCQTPPPLSMCSEHHMSLHYSSTGTLKKCRYPFHEVSFPAIVHPHKCPRTTLSHSTAFEHHRPPSLDGFGRSVTTSPASRITLDRHRPP
jgi:hypothetical protein